MRTAMFVALMLTVASPALASRPAPASPNPPRQPASLETSIYNFGAALRQVCFPYIFEDRDQSNIVPSTYVNPDASDAAIVAKAGGASYRVGTAGNVHVRLRAKKQSGSRTCTVALGAQESEAARQLTLDLIDARGENFRPVADPPPRPGHRAPHDVLCANNGVTTFLTLISYPLPPRTEPALTVTLTRGPAKGAICVPSSVAQGPTQHH